MGEATKSQKMADGLATEGGSLLADGGGNITWSHLDVSREDRWRLLGQRGGLVWFTGLSGSGKSTLATSLDVSLHRLRRASFVLDGDNLRHGLCRDLGFSDSDRTENIRRAGEVGCLMAEAGLIVICSLISPFAADRQLVREACAKQGVNFLEIYVNAPLAVCENRDPKGLYRKARQGKIQGFTGIDSPYEPPQNPDLELRTDLHSLEVCQEALAKCVLSTMSVA
ncbi:adenylyl-sulfate kinase [Prosthecobacter sp.]|uniref:adenylyl-sulfate kinase n=1 Tax=Prosthecobacter sp. TaxID=1965333 RepID=UPI0037832A59